jgi:hypothetical protein
VARDPSALTRAQARRLYAPAGAYQQPYLVLDEVTGRVYVDPDQTVPGGSEIYAREKDDGSFEFYTAGGTVAEFLTTTNLTSYKAEVAQDAADLVETDLFAAVVTPPGTHPLGDTVAVQSAVSAITAGGSGRVLLGAGAYNCPNGITVTGRTAKLEGAGGLYTHDAGTFPGHAATTINVSSATASGITVTAGGCTLVDLAVVCTAATPTAGAGISASNVNQFAMARCTVAGFYDLLTVDNAWFYSVDGCRFFDPVRYAVRQTTTTSGYRDHADCGYSNNVFSMVSRTADASAAFRLEGGGGVRWTGNKIVGQGQPGSSGVGVFDIGIDVAMAAGVSTVELEIVGGGISNCRTACLRVTGASGTSFSRISVNGCTVQGYGGSNSTVGLLLQGAAGSNATIHSVIVDGNTLVSLGGGGIVADCLTGLTIGVNNWINTPVLLTIAGTADSTGIQTRQVHMVTQNFGPSSGLLPTDVVIVRDRRAILGSTGHTGGRIEKRYTVPVYLTSVGTWVTLASFRPVSTIGSSKGAGFVEVDASGHDSGFNAWHRRIVQGYLAENATATTLPVGGAQDVTLSIGSPHVDFRFDTSTAGVVKIQAQLTTSGAAVGGLADINVKGWVGEFALGDLTLVP